MVPLERDGFRLREIGTECDWASGTEQQSSVMRSLPLDLGDTPIHRPGTLKGKALEPLEILESLEIKVSARFWC